MVRVALWCALGTLLAAAVAPVAARPPAMDIPVGERQAGMLQSSKEQVKARVEYWMKELAAAGSAEEVKAARNGLLNDYTGYTADAREFMETYAEYTDAFGQKLLGQGLRGDDPLKGLKEVNLAMAASRMTQLPIQPLLEKMVAHPNPGVRLLAWQGYARARTTMLSASVVPPKPLPAKVMFESMRKAAATEADGMVAAELVGAMLMSPKSGEDGVPTGTHSDAQKEFLKTLEANWTRMCKAVRDGDPSMAEACQRGVRALLPLSEGLGGDSVKTSVLQLTLNAAYAASVAYDRAEQLLPAIAAAKDAADAAAKAAAPGADDAARDAAKAKAATVAALAGKLKVEPAAMAAMGEPTELAYSRASLLLQGCEAALNRLTGKQERLIEGPLKQSAGERGAAVRLAVLKWEEMLQPMGVKSPKDQLK